MWTKGILTRYAESLEDQEQDAALKKEIANIQYSGNSEACVAVEGEQAFVRANIAELYRDFADRFLEFATEEDFRAILNN
jgi:hypothetical protein